MKNVMVSSLLFVATLCSAQVTPVEDSVYVYNNSPYNFANSPYNYTNSPYNYDNSQFNPYAKNAIYDAQGNRAGYSTTTDQNVTNYYDNQGVRQGYQVK